MTNLQREVFAFVADFDKVCKVTFTVEAGPEEAVDNIGVSGVARFVGIPLNNATTLEAKRKAGVRQESVVMTGKAVEVGMGFFYVVQEDGREENFTGKATAALYRAIDDYAKTRTFITCNLDFTISEPDEVIVD